MVLTSPKLRDAARKFLPEKQAETIQRRAIDLKARVNPNVPASVRATLRPYQLDGFHFLAYLTTNRFGGVLADDMGLGKTLQALTWLAWLRDQSHAAKSPPPPSLVVCPKSVMDNWHAEAMRFLPGLRVRLWRGEDTEAPEQAREETDLIVIHSAQLRNLSPRIAEIPWQAVILAEAQYIMWFERYIIVPISLSINRMPFTWRLYEPGIEIPLGIGTLAFFILLYMAASRLIPLIPVWEVEESQMAHELKKFGRETVVSVSELE